jgi:pimeloyl-ACP methyl ester carboxylesterase
LMDAASRTMPRATGRVAAIAMLVPGRRMRVRPEQREVMDRARREILQVGRHRLQVYRWGSGERSMLLVHGWQGRAAQFAELVARFEGEATIVAFDAPAHGESRGISADIGMWIQAIRALDARFDFDVLVAHSFGGLAALRAHLARLVRATVVSISAPPSTDAVMRAYARQVGLTDAVASAVNAALARRLGPVMASIAMGSPVRSPDPVERVRTGADNPGIFVVHDRADRAVPVVAAHAIESWWPGPATVMLTEGLGHNRILAAPEVLDAIASFASAVASDPLPAA